MSPQADGPVASPRFSRTASPCSMASRFERSFRRLGFSQTEVFVGGTGYVGRVCK